MRESGAADTQNEAQQRYFHLAYLVLAHYDEVEERAFTHSRVRVPEGRVGRAIVQAGSAERERPFANQIYYPLL